MGTTIGRLYFYAVAFISLVVAVYGGGSLLATLGKLVLETGSPAASDIVFWRTVLSTYIPMLALGGFVWGVHWYAARRRVARFTEEQQSPLRKLYLNALLGVAAVVALFNAARLVYHLLSAVTGESLPAFGEGRGRAQDIYNAGIWLLAYGLVWYYHRQADHAEGQQTAAARTLRRWHLYIVSFLSLGTLGLGLFYNLALLLTYLVEGTSTLLAGRGLGAVLGNWSLTLAPMLAGAAWWTYHWRYAAKGDVTSTLRQLYLYAWVFIGVAGVAGGAGAILYQVLRVAFGYRAVSLSIQLSFLEYAVPLLVLGGAVWLYHRAVIHEESGATEGALASVRRRYNYLVAGLGLLALAVGVANVLRVFLEILFQRGVEIGFTPDWWRDQLSTFLAMTVVGVVVWLPHWQSMQRQAVRDEAEPNALSRRLLLYLILFAAVITILFNGAFFLNGLLRLALGEPASGGFLSRVFTNLGNVLVVGTFLLYYWQVLQRDRSAAATVAAASPVKTLTALAPEQMANSVRRLEQALGTRITVLTTVPAGDGDQPAGDLVPIDVETVAERVKNAPGEKALLVFTPSGVEIHPYR